MYADTARSQAFAYLRHVLYSCPIGGDGVWLSNTGGACSSRGIWTFKPIAMLRLMLLLSWVPVCPACCLVPSYRRTVKVEQVCAKFQM